MYSEGFHQPTILIVNMITDHVGLTVEGRTSIIKASDLQITISPNPVRSILHVNLQAQNQEEVFLGMTDLSGKTIMKQKIDPFLSSFDVDLSHFATGMYLLRFSDIEGIPIQSFKVTKMR